MFSYMRSSLDPSPSSDALDPIFDRLKSTNKETRVQSTEDLGKHVQALIRELSSDGVQKMWEANISKRLVLLVGGQSSAEKHGGLLAINRLTSLVEHERLDPKRNLPRLYNYVKTVFPSTDYDIMEFAAEILGKIVKSGGPLFGEAFMDFELPGSIQLLQSEAPEGRYAGILVLKELASCNTTIFYPHASLVLEKLSTPVRGPRPEIREAAAGLLATCLDILQLRDKQSINHVLTKILHDCRTGLKSESNSIEVVHGCLLVCAELFKHAGMFLNNFYFETAEMILRFRNHRNAFIRKAVVSLIPVLADYDNQKFVDHILHRAMVHLMEQMVKPTERSTAFIAIGHVAKSVGSEINIFLEPVMQQIKYGLQQRGKKNAVSEEPLFECLALLASAAGPGLTKLLNGLLDLIFDNQQLTEALVTALVVISRNIPALLRTIQLRLLDLISITLSGQIYAPLGAPSKYARPDIRASTYQNCHPMSLEQIRLALDTLGTFDFSGQALSEFVCNCALPYVEDDSPEIRKTAALTSCRLFVRDPICHQVSDRAIEIVSDVLHKLLAVAIADPDAEIRRKVLEALDERFDKHLSQAENIRSIFIAINDEVFENRIIAVKLIGRLAQQNPAPVMPSLRKALIQMMTELHLATSIRTREECSQLLKVVIQNTQRLIKPYAVSMFVPLLDLATVPNSTVAANIMDCIGELSVIAAEDAISYVPGLMKIILAQLVEPIPIKRDAALRALGQVCSSTGYVIQPLVDYPELSPILHRILKSESSSTVRREVLRVLGNLGAIDPYRRKLMQEEGTSVDVSPPAAISLRNNPSAYSSPDEYLQTVVINSLLEILKDPLLNHMHHVVIESVMSIIRSQRLNCLSYLPQIITAFTEGTRTARYQEFFLSSLAALVGIIKEHVRIYVHEIFRLIMSLWDNVSVQQQLISLIEALGKAVDTEFKPYLSEVLPPMLRIFDGETSEKKSNAQMKVFDAFLTFGSNVEEYLHLIIPVVVKAYEREGTIALRRRAVQTIEGLTRRVNVSDHASRIIHPLIRTLSATPNTELRLAVMETLCALVLQLGTDFEIFIPIINKVLRKTKISNAKYEGLIAKLLKGERVAQANNVVDSRFDTVGAPEASAPTKFEVNQQHLKRAWDTSQISTEEDWNRWFSRLAQELIKQSPSHALRACASVVSEHNPFALVLFNAAFLSCWTELYDRYQGDLVKSIERAIGSETISKELAHKLLHLAEFMERDDKPLLIDDRSMGQYTMNINAYGKALHYKELEYFAAGNTSQGPSASLVEELIQINSNLQQLDAAFGILTVANRQHDVSKHEVWYERLHRWRDALAAYERRTRADPHNPEVIMGTIRCLHALGEWAKLARCAEDYWAKATDYERREMAGMGAAAAWSLSEWDSMDDYIAAMGDNAPDRSFFKAVLAVQKSQFRQAGKNIARARDLLSTEFTPDVEESRTRTYNFLIRAQMLSELEEIIIYKQYADQPEQQASMKRMWTKRLRGCQPEVESWQRILQVRSLVLRPCEESSMWIEFANLCRQSDRMMLAEKAINSLIDLSNERDILAQSPPSVIYAQLKFMWAKFVVPEERKQVLAHLCSFTSDLEGNFRANSNAVGNDEDDETTKLLARCHFKQGEWKNALHDRWSLDAARAVINSFHLATQYDKTWYKAWHTWALVNFEVAEQLPVRSRGDEEEMKLLIIHVRQAIEGFFWSISLHKENSLQDTLRLLNIWFVFGSFDGISHVIADGFSKVDVDTWLDVLPQIIARIQTPSIPIRENINSLLNEVGMHHPQALVYPLSVASKSSSQSRKKVALDLMDRLRAHSVAIVEQALLVGQELVRVAMLWHELWFEGLEEASRFYITHKNPEGMIAVLAPLHDVLDEGPTTLQETTFVQSFGHQLHEARELCLCYRTTGDVNELKKGWGIYCSVYKNVAIQRSQVTTLDLQYVSPELLRAQNLELAVPGTYSSGKDVVYIRSFDRKLSVLSSKQRPRRLTVKGNDGVDYDFILKGHEDLRQDERVMQLFSLVNTLLSSDIASHKRQLQIRQYPVIPIAPNVGLLGFVEDSDTLNDLVRDYRLSRKIRFEMEYSLMLRMAPDYESLTPLQKVEVFEYALDNTTGQDLYRSLWHKSVSSEHWLERRTTYTRSLAVGSMVGYILGLGDRHPSNIMLERSTGKVVHIDFGECFEVAILRKEYPEKVPFRLTRMLRRAMEVSGIQGTFKNTCEISMRVLRDNKESLMAVLEAFVYDPLINWRLEIDNYRIENSDDRQAQFIREAAGHPQGPNRRLTTNENDIFNDMFGTLWAAGGEEVRNERAIAVVNRVKQKLTGRDFKPEEELKVNQQVEKLILAATSVENICQHFPGWCAFW